MTKDNTKHTPGPWKWHYSKAFFGDETAPACLFLETETPQTDISDPCILAVRDDWVGYLDRSEQGKANCHLIAAAPELLEACKASIAAYETGDDIALSQCFTKWLPDAIRKAEGK